MSSAGLRREMVNMCDYSMFYQPPKTKKPDLLKGPVSGSSGEIEISNQLISDLLEFVEVAEELVNSKEIRKHEFEDTKHHFILPKGNDSNHSQIRSDSLVYLIDFFVLYRLLAIVSSDPI
jgi:hypothetical protein